MYTPKEDTHPTRAIHAFPTSFPGECPAAGVVTLWQYAAITWTAPPARMPTPIGAYFATAQPTHKNNTSNHAPAVSRGVGGLATPRPQTLL